MGKQGKKKTRRDVGEIALSVVEKATGGKLSGKDEPESQEPPPKDTRNQAAVELGKLGASKGGKARAERLSKKRRKEIAQQAAKARWKRKKQ